MKVLGETISLWTSDLAHLRGKAIRTVAAVATLTSVACLYLFAAQPTAAQDKVNTASAPILTFSDVAGQWKGAGKATANGKQPREFKIDIRLETSGAFKLETNGFGDDSSRNINFAKIENGKVVIRFTGGTGELTLALIDGKLSGSGLFGSWGTTVTLEKK